ncbi:MAG: hypothetical protein U0872_04640 [Planctomycetaceae bacterium]
MADILDSDPQVQRRLEEVTLGPAPSPGRKTKITQQMIRERLLAQGINLTEIEFTGKSMLLLQSSEEAPAKPAPVPSAAVARTTAFRHSSNPTARRKAEEIVQAAFQQHYHHAESKTSPLTLSVEIADEDLDAILRSSPQSLQFSEQGLRRGGPQTLTAHVTEATGNRREIRMQVWLNDMPQIMTVKYTVPKGKVLEESDLVRMPAKHGQTGGRNS